MAFAPTSKIVAAPEQVSSELDGDSVILNLKTGLYFGLNEVGAKIWEKVQDPTTFQEICDSIQSEYEVSATECSQDVSELLEDMVKAELISIEN